MKGIITEAKKKEKATFDKLEKDLIDRSRMMDPARGSFEVTIHPQGFNTTLGGIHGGEEYYDVKRRRFLGKHDPLRESITRRRKQRKK